MSTRSKISLLIDFTGKSNNANSKHGTSSKQTPRFLQREEVSFGKRKANPDSSRKFHPTQEIARNNAREVKVQISCDTGN